MKTVTIRLLLCIVSLLCLTWQAHARIGMNLAGVHDYSSQLIFVDLFKQSMPWMTRNADGTGVFNTRVAVPMQADGYPRAIPFYNGSDPPQIAHTLMATNIAGHYPEGAYTLIFEGSGEIMLDGDAGELALVMRFMETVSINGLRLQSWTQRKTVDFVTPAYDGESGSRVNPGNIEGLAMEYRLALCNRLHADLWINIPHMANDDFVKQMARFIHASLDPSLNIYIEYSNEIWNPGFPQAQWARAQGIALELSKDPVTAGRRFAADVFHIFEVEFGDSTRLVKVLGGQRANLDVATQPLAAFNDSCLNPFGVQADALAIGAYFGGRLADEIGDAGKIKSVEVILDSLAAEIQHVVTPQIISHMTLARAYGLHLVAYEGGQALRAKNPRYQNNAIVTAKLHAANRDPRMKELYLALLDAWYQSGGRLFCAFNYVHKFTNTGSWGDTGMDGTTHS